MGLFGNKNTVKTGYWTQHAHLFKSDTYECSACHNLAKKAYKNCPNCNARMKRSKYDPQWVDELEFLDAILDD